MLPGHALLVGINGGKGGKFRRCETVRGFGVYRGAMEVGTGALKEAALGNSLHVVSAFGGVAGANRGEPRRLGTRFSKGL